MNHLLRGHAPITDAGWELLDQEARERITPALAARRLVDFAGPQGWQHSATNLGRVEELAPSLVEGADGVRRRVLPLVELRARFQVSRAELLDYDRGAADPDLDDLDAAARRLALAENVAVFHGWAAAGIAGIAEASPHAPVARADDFERYPHCVVRAVEVLRQNGIADPYALALSPRDYDGVSATAERGGYPLFRHLRDILGGPIVWAPGVEVGVVLSLRGGDFLLDSGEDISLGYSHHDADDVYLYLEESFSFRVATPEAAVALTTEAAPTRRRTTPR